MPSSIDDSATPNPGASSTAEVGAVSNERMSLRDAADALDIPLTRLFRLGHYLGLASTDARIPLDVIARAAGEVDTERRYQIIRDWLLAENRQKNRQDDSPTV
jgi:hypothetical protein